MRRRALLSGLLVGGLAVVSSLAVRPLLDIPLDPEDGGEEEEPQLPPPIEPPSPEPPPLGPDEEEEEKPPTEPA